MPVRGLRVFVRPIEPSDGDALNAFFALHAPATPAPACGLLGKLLGDVVAVVGIDLGDDAMRIDHILVAHELRRKWIGRVMLRELEQLAAKMDRRMIVIDDAGDAREFFRRVGFIPEGERWVRAVPQ
jgi:GNAT superfamily N-acetyltransferase